jgi:polyhydroxybutyrate depolymerase
MLVHVAGIELSDKITAIAPVAATVSKEITEQQPKVPIPVLMVHGMDDHLLPFNSRNDDRFLPGSQVVDYWVKSNRCSTEPIINASDAAIMESYSSSSKADVHVMKVKGAGHVWPGSKVYLKSEPDPKLVDASRLIWEFFRSHID